MWNATVLSLFPEMFPGTLDFSIAGKALRKNLWSLKTVNIRQFSNNKNGKVDEVPFGGGPGMVINPEVLDKALKSVSKEKYVVYSSSNKRRVWCRILISNSTFTPFR